MAQIFKNNTTGTLASELAAGATACTLNAGHTFTDPGSDWYLATLVGVTGTTETSWEIVKVTNVATNTLTIERAQESTSDATWPAGTRIEARLTAGATESKANLGAAAYKAVGTGSGDVAAGNRGVTNGDSHDHNGGDGAQIAYSSLSGTPTLGTAASKDVGTGSGQVAAGDHDHASTYQPLDSDLTALAGLSTTGLIERTGAGTAGIVTVTTAGKALLDDSDAAAQRTTLGIGGFSQDGSGNFTRIVPGGSTGYPDFPCRAWLDATVTDGTPAVRASGNVSSITDAGVGTFTVNLTNAMPDDTCCVAAWGYGMTRGYVDSSSTVAVRIYDVASVDRADLSPFYMALFR